MANYGKFSPVIKYGIPDYPRDSGKWFDWLDEQYHYFLNGYTSGSKTISGRYYWKLNFTRLLMTDEYGNKRPQAPYYVDAGVEFYDLLEECLVNGKNILVGKGRDKGFTYDIASLSLYQTQVIPYSKILALFPGGQSPAKKNFRNAYNLSYNELLDDLRHHPGLTDSLETLEYGWKEKDEETGKDRVYGIQTELTMKEAVNADVGKSGRYKFVILEEFGELKDPLKLITTSDANMREGAKKFGIIIAGGTSNAFNAGYKDFRELWHNPDSRGFVKYFIPANKAYWGFVNYETGQSDLMGAKEHRMKIRDKLSGDDLLIEMQNYPFEEKEMFISVKQSPFARVAGKINDQINNVMTDKFLQKSIAIGNLIDEKGDGENVVFHECKGGRWQVFKKPDSTLLTADVAGVDTYRMSNVTDSDSKGAIVVYRGFQGMNKPGNMPVCIYHHRHTDKEQFFMDCLLTARYYKCKLLIEYTEEDIFTWFRQHNALKFLKERPKVVDTPYSKNTYLFGVKPTEGAINIGIEYAVNEIEKNCENYVYVDLLDELINFGTQNTDIAMAYVWAMVHSIDHVRRIVTDKKEVKRNFMPYTAINGAGEMVTVTSEKEEQLYGFQQ